MTKSVFTQRYALLRELLIDARKQRKWTQAALAKRLGKPQSFVSKYERGERRLDVIEFLEVAELLQLNSQQFIDKLARAGKK